ncbi:Protein of unknown function DUF2800 [uncultured Caudovirales phage]|uniref:Uncharacterized protein n=1 Tax=uncultured Caudovirales phage TaxID=2100421 RepID=A0A6J5L4N0_9CAUD|nr:Protein of unknown function DUF2800 [uncultured Caudovirales phage]
MAAHALLSASGSKRWLACTPSARLEATLPEQKKPKNAFDFSAEGTTAHSLAEIKLLHHFGQISTDEYNREYEIIKLTQYYNEEFEAHVDNYVLYVRSQVGDGDEPLFEQKTDFSDWIPEGFGTADVVILSKHKVRVIDLKFGAGIPVDAKDNPQLRLYALGAWSKFKDKYPDITEIEYTIHQPRLNSITTDSTTLNKLVDWANFYVKPKAKKAWVGEGDFIAGDHCQFCRAKSQCRARADFNTALARMEFRDPPLLSDVEMSEVLDKAQDLKSWVSDVEGYALDKAVETGLAPKGYKLATSVTHRKIIDIALASEVLISKGIPKNEIWEQPKMKSIASLEKLAAKGQIVTWLGDLVQRPEGTPKLVRDRANDAGDDFK